MHHFFIVYYKIKKSFKIFTIPQASMSSQKKKTSNNLLLKKK